MATFLEYYEREIMSRLTMADLILKTGQEPYDLTQMLSCLQLSKEQAGTALWFACCLYTGTDFLHL